MGEMQIPNVFETLEILILDDFMVFSAFFAGSAVRKKEKVQFLILTNRFFCPILAIPPREIETTLFSVLS